jgi:hypothetical protein
MAKKGAFGEVDFGAGPDAVGEIRNWNYSAEAAEIDTTVMGTGNARFQPGSVRHTFEIEVFYELADAGQAAMYAALGSDTATLTVLYPNGNSAGLTSWTGNFFVMGAVRNAAADGAVEASLTLSSDENGVTAGTV